jgi:hypothetical protein
LIVFSLYSGDAVTADWQPTRTVALLLDLPEELADEVEQLQHRDPDLLRRMFSYALLRAAVVEGLSRPVTSLGINGNT